MREFNTNLLIEICGLSGFAVRSQMERHTIDCLEDTIKREIKGYTLKGVDKRVVANARAGEETTMVFGALTPDRIQRYANGMRQRSTTRGFKLMSVGVSKCTVTNQDRLPPVEYRTLFDIQQGIEDGSDKDGTGLAIMSDGLDELRGIPNENSYEVCSIAFLHCAKGEDTSLRTYPCEEGLKYITEHPQDFVLADVTWTEKAE